MKLKSCRPLSFLAVAGIYLLAAAGGILLYLALPFSAWLSLLIADAAATVFVFLFSLLLGNASVYDPYWSVQPMVILLGYLCGGHIHPGGILITAVVCIWG